MNTPTNKKEVRNFIENIIAKDLDEGKHEGYVITRFPPQPNGYLHVGHAKTICLNFGLAADNAPKSACHLRFDDTNPEKESIEYVEAIKKDIKWLGFDWKDKLFFASDYFEKLHDFAIELIEKGLAYVDDQNAEEIAKSRGNFQTPGLEAPHRERSVKENLDLFARMVKGEFKDGEKVLRAKIDMASNYMCMRDPVMYRIKHVEHHRTGNKWCIYPMYDFTHGLSDALENVTHSLCSLEFQDNRVLYDWFVDNTSVEGKPHQYEFARLNLDYTVMSKRKLLRLVEENHVEGWDDPRMPTIAAMRRRGYPPAAIRNFMKTIGVGKQDNVIELSILEEAVRSELNQTSKRCLAVLEPLKVTITNWEGEDKTIVAPFHPQDESFGVRTINFGREIWVEQSDFMEDAPSPKKWFRLAPGRSVRLRYAYVITCEEVIKDDQGNVIELKCIYHEDSFAGQQPAALDKKVKGIIHWVNAKEAVDIEVRLFDRLFRDRLPEESGDFIENINPESVQVIKAKCEPFLRDVSAGEQVQFERMGYFSVDEKLSKPLAPVFNRTVTLRDNYSK